MCSVLIHKAADDLPEADEDITGNLDVVNCSAKASTKYGGVRSFGPTQAHLEEYYIACWFSFCGVGVSGAQIYVLLGTAPEGEEKLLKERSENTVREDCVQMSDDDFTEKSTDTSIVSRFPYNVRIPVMYSHCQPVKYSLHMSDAVCRFLF